MFGLFGNLYFYLNRHHTTAHRQRDARVALASNFKGKMHSQQKLFTKCMTEMFALKYVLGFLRILKKSSDYLFKFMAMKTSKCYKKSKL